MAKKSARNRYKQRLTQSLNLLATVIEYNEEMVSVYAPDYPQYAAALEASNTLIVEAGTLLAVLNSSL